LGFTKARKPSETGCKPHDPRRKTAAERTKATDFVKTDSKPTQNTRFDINDIIDITLAGRDGGR
jgi:hypothetical protein